MAENESTSTATPSVEPAGTEAATAAKPADAEVVAAAAAGVAGHIVPADEQHVDPQELFGGEVVEPEHAEEKAGETFEPLGAINSRP
ncbi:hypothetical protein ACFVVX_12870 [Kitasatospora sp. NPDC058170]|uniref:hypothetical protein n=1 Tax=Kitasatospora sp. NPDC058170 TaxID=3346364 RepID=UPI0036DAD223